MKRNRKKSISVIMAFLLALQASGTIFAENTDAGSTGTGQVNVSISPALALERTVDFTAALTGNDGQVLTQVLALGAGDMAEDVCFSRLSDGYYTLKVSADGFADYEQIINVDKQAASVKLMTGFADGIDYNRGTHPGTLLIGDANNDGIVDDLDRKQLTDAIDGRTGSGVTDLNGDGSIDLVDLEYLAKGYRIGENTQATLETLIPSTVIKPSAGDGTYVAGGSLENLFVKNGGVQLATADGGVISSEDPVVLQFDVTDSGLAARADGIAIGVSGENPVTRAEVYIDYIDGGGAEATQLALIENGVHHLLDDGNVTVEQDSRGNIRINLGSQIAVKRVTIKISGMRKESSIAEISYVEFVNGMENKISEPASDMPENLTASAGNKSFTLNWDKCVNVTGYEVMIMQSGKSEVKKVSGCSLSVTSFNGSDLTNGIEYTVMVQSVNGAWKSGWCDPVNVIPKASAKPDRPDGLTAAGAYRSVRAAWKKAEDAERYNLYYKLRSDTEYTKIGNITATSYTISDLEDKSEYVLYVTAENEYGESGPSLTAAASTTDVSAPVMPKYNLINTGETGEKGQHIVSASQNHGTMTGSPLDENAGTAWGTVDHDPNSYYLRTTWDDGGYNYIGSNGLFYEFDEEYTIQSFALFEAVPTSPNLFYTKVNYWDANGVQTSLNYGQVSTIRKTDSEGRAYYLIKLPQKAQIKKIQIGLARYLASGNINVSEVYFYRYDTIEDDIANLYDDDLHLVLKPEVTQETIDGLRARLNTPDPVSGEYNPDRERLETELKNAEDILNCKDLGDPVYIHNEISTSDVNRGFGGLNAWQPVGVTAAAGDTVTVYVGHNTKTTGAATNLQLVATQYHAESSAMASTVATLKVGANVIDIPKIWSIDEESGGALYIQYTGSNANDSYAVRVSGGVHVPVLDLYGVEDESEKLARAEAYIEELQAYLDGMEALHEQYHANSSNSNVNRYSYNERNCILGASDILLDNMLLSLPAKRILDGTGYGGTSEKAAQIVRSTDAIEDMLYLFYQHKGLNDNAENVIDRLPKGHLNIRYQRMFSGAFMYAAGNHIGVQWAESANPLALSGVVSDENGRYISGSYLGWGMTHEIGHCINQGAYAVAEITNNYFAQLARAKDTNSGMRFTYDNIYDKVTSGATGQAPSVSTQLGMYWQLHLAYDNGYNYKTYDNHSEQLANLFYARMDSYSRNTSLAPAPGGIQLTLDGGTDQNLMRLACAAAEKNILEFFERWGKIPDSTTVQYASQFAKEERAIYYTDDDSRVYRIENPYGGYLGTSGNVQAVGMDTSANVSWNDPSQVVISLSAENIPADEVLGYEITRCTTSGGQVAKEVVGFTTGSTFTDYAAGLNNRVVTYEVTVVDKYLYRSAPKTLNPIKIQDDGSLDKTWWTVSSTGLTASVSSNTEASSDDMPCAPKADDPIFLAADGNSITEYIGTVSANAEITLGFNRYETVTGFRYTAGSGAALGNYSIMVRTENGSWLEAASGYLGGSGTVFFENADRKYISTYKADAVKLVILDQPGQEISVAELDVLGVTGDDVDFKSADGTAAIGVLSEDYRYGSGENDVIPKGSVVFTGAYKGNPAYSVVMLFDQNGNVVGGADSAGYLTAHQIILADDPGSGLLEDVANGTWIYWLTPEDNVSLSGISRVRAELYRVNDAFTNEGERLVSDSIFADIPQVLPEISLGGGRYEADEKNDDTASTEAPDSTETTDNNAWNTEAPVSTGVTEAAEE